MLHGPPPETSLFALASTRIPFGGSVLNWLLFNTPGHMATSVFFSKKSLLYGFQQGTRVQSTPTSKTDTACMPSVR